MVKLANYVLDIKCLFLPQKVYWSLGIGRDQRRWRRPRGRRRTRGEDGNRGWRLVSRCLEKEQPGPLMATAGSVSKCDRSHRKLSWNYENIFNWKWKVCQSWKNIPKTSSDNLSQTNHWNNFCFQMQGYYSELLNLISTENSLVSPQYFEAGCDGEVVIDALESGNSCSCPPLFIIRRAWHQILEEVKRSSQEWFIIFPQWNSLSSSLKSLANKATKSTARTKQFILQPEHSCHFELTSFRLNQIKFWILPKQTLVFGPIDFENLWKPVNRLRITRQSKLCVF